MNRVEHPNLPDTIADRLRAALNAGVYPPGARLVERRLAEEYGVSHIPVREALTKLADEGLITRLPRRGARVSQLSPRMLDEIRTLRTTLEQFAIGLVQAQWSETSERELRAIVADMVAAARKKDADAVFELDKLFHDRLWQLSGHELLIDMLSQLRGRIDRFLLATNRALKPSALLKHAQSHSILLDAISGGDPEEARAAITIHIGTAAERISSETDPLS